MVTISRKWNSPEIEQTVWSEGEEKDGKYLRLRISLEDFVVALKEEVVNNVGSVTTVITKKQIADKLNGAIDKAIAEIVKGIKEEWLKHPH
jgi:hypothetical protein